MSITFQTSRSHHRSPAVWYVSDGARVVGPVATELLLRGIAHRRIPSDCMVRQESWSSWRGLHQIREVARLGRTPLWAPVLQIEADPQADAESKRLADIVAQSPDLGEALLYALHAAVKATGQPRLGLVTSAAHGEGLEKSLGQLLRLEDPALLLARSGQPAFGPPGAGPLERSIASRLAVDTSGPGGIAMVPILQDGSLLAMIELGRPDHLFRRGDCGALEEVARWVMRRG
jgi:hypothetical protein